MTLPDNQLATIPGETVHDATEATIASSSAAASAGAGAGARAGALPQANNKLDPAILDAILGKSDAQRMMECVTDLKSDGKLSLDQKLQVWDELELVRATDSPFRGLWGRQRVLMFCPDGHTDCQQLVENIDNANGESYFQAVRPHGGVAPNLDSSLSTYYPSRRPRQHEAVATHLRLSLRPRGGSPVTSMLGAGDSDTGEQRLQHSSLDCLVLGQPVTQQASICHSHSFTLEQPTLANCIPRTRPSSQAARPAAE